MNYPIKTIEKFAARFVISNSGCWEWKAGMNIQGYGRFYDSPKVQAAHRFGYEIVKGKVPDNLQVDHLYRNRKCVNAAHLEAVTPRENTIRGNTLASLNSKKTECIHGHKYTPENTTVVRSNHLKRACKECNRIRSRKQQRLLRSRSTRNG